MVSACFSVKPLDLGYKGDDVMCLKCLFVINLVKVSDKNGGTLSVNSYLGGP